MIKRLAVKGYKSLDDVEIRFTSPLTVVIGASTAGVSAGGEARDLLRPRG